MMVSNDYIYFLSYSVVNCFMFGYIIINGYN